MSASLMVALVGEQPIPNLLAVRHEKPAAVLLVETDSTARVADHLSALFSGVERVRVPAYDIASIRAALVRKVSGRDEVTYNLTGGTKPMALAAYGLAQESRQPVSYVQSEGGTSLYYRYGFEDSQPVLVSKETLPTLLTIDDYLRAHYGVYSDAEPAQWFERLVWRTLEDSQQLDETKTCIKVGGAMEVDLVVRKGNYVGYAELKSGADETHKAGIDQITGAADRVVSGTFTRRMLINDRQLDRNVLALAQARGVRVVTLTSARPDRPLDRADRETLLDETLRFLGRFGDRR